MYNVVISSDQNMIMQECCVCECVCERERVWMWVHFWKKILETFCLYYVVKMSY